MRHDPVPVVPADILSMTGPEAVQRFARWAEKLAAENERRTGRPLPGNQGFSVSAKPRNEA